jgi:hypothetical protein
MKCINPSELNILKVKQFESNSYTLHFMILQQLFLNLYLLTSEVLLKKKEREEHSKAIVSMWSFLALRKIPSLLSHFIRQFIFLTHRKIEICFLCNLYHNLISFSVYISTLSHHDNNSIKITKTTMISVMMMKVNMMIMILTE